MTNIVRLFRFSIQLLTKSQISQGKLHPSGTNLADEMSTQLSNDTVVFNGHGQPTDWSDPLNWVGGTAPNSTSSTAFIPMSATLNGNFTTAKVMMLGQEAVTVNGTLSTLSPGFCTSFMVCAGAVATFTATSALNDAGGLIVGNLSNGTMLAKGSGGQHAQLSSHDGKMGVRAGSHGSMTIDNAVWNNTNLMFVGLAGQGSLVVSNGGQVTVGSCLYIGAQAGAVGSVSLAGGAQMSVGLDAKVGGGAIGDYGGAGALSVASGATFSAVDSLWVTASGTVTLSGGTIMVAKDHNGLNVAAGGSVSGFGVINIAPSTIHPAGIVDNGTIQASGGTLTLNSWVAGTGHLQIAFGATLALDASHVGLPGIGFVGSDATLVLAHGLSEHAPITGFTDGDSIVQAGIDHMGFNTSTDVMTLSSGSTVVDTLQFAGTYASNAFTLSQTSAGAMITVHTGH